MNLSQLTLRDWVELIAVVVIASSSVMRWIHARETSDTTLEARVKTLEDVEHVCSDDFAVAQRDIDALKENQKADHGAQKQDRENFNTKVGVVKSDVDRHDERLKSLFARVAVIDRRLEQQGKS